MGPLLNSPSGIEDTLVKIPKERETNKDVWCELGLLTGICVLKIFFFSLTASPIKCNGDNKEDRESEVVTGDSDPGRDGCKSLFLETALQLVMLP